MKTPIKEVPKYMQKGSKGPHVILLQVFLLGTNLGKMQLVADGDFGEMTVQSLMNYQYTSSLEKDGCFGPATRSKMAKDELFDFNVICPLILGKTQFVQDEGEIIEYEVPMAA